MQSNFKRQRGVAFFEVLISVVIISIGFLATTKMQVMGMKYNQSAFFKSQASTMAADIADRMRTNISGVNSGAYDSINTENLPSDPGCMNSGCSPSDLATLDIHQWGGNLSRILPDGAGYVTKTGDLFEIRVSWNEKVSTDTETQSVKIWLNL